LAEAAISFLQGWLNLDSLSILRLAAMVLSLVIAVYLLTVPRKSLSTLFLSGIFWSAFLFNVASFFEFAGPFYWQPRTVKTVLVLLAEDIGPALAALFLLLFAYHFPRFRRSEWREFKIVIPLSVAVNAAVLGLNLYNFFFLQWRLSETRLWDIYWLVFYCSMLAQFIGALFLLFRKAVRLSGRGSGSFLQKILRPHGRDAESARALGVILLLPLLAVASSLAMTYRILPFALANYLTWLGFLLFYFGFILTYMNHGADPMTLQMKMLGVVLVLVLCTMGVVALVVGENSAADYRLPSPPPTRSTIRFAPNASQSYDIRRVADAFDPDVGPRVDVEYGRPRVVALAFDFPFFSSAYRTIHVLNGPMIYLGETVRENGWGGYNPQPAIAPLIMNLDPRRGGGIRLKAGADSVTVTWFRLPELDADNENTIQLVLRADGTIDMSFQRLSPESPPSVEQLYNYTAASTTGGNPSPGGAPAAFPPRLTGIHPGTQSAPLEEISFARDLPWRSVRPAVIFESYEADFAEYLSGRIGVLAALTVAASILVLLLIPLLMRTSLFTPLRALSRGMQLVEGGSLEAAIRVQSFDEIGSLARSFNRMVESMKRAESSFRTLAEDSRDGIVVVVDETIAYANRRAAEMTGYPMTDLSQARFDTLFKSTALPAFGVQPDAPVEALLAALSGPLLPVELVYSRTLWRGRPAIAVVIRDITQRKREEETAQRQQQHLMRMDKLTSLGVLASGLAHEINVPNQVILDNVSVLVRSSPQLSAILQSAAEADEDSLVAGLRVSEFRRHLPELLSGIMKSSTLIGGIIKDLKDFSADSTSPGTALFDVNTAIRGAVALVAVYIRRATDHFTLDLHPGLPRARGSVRRLEQVFINLILNACQSLPGRDKAIVIRSIGEDSGSAVKVVVHDEGVGIPPEILPRVREQFFTTRESSGGTGLGLFVSQEIVSAHKGTLQLASQPGVGTDVTVTLPAEVKR
jgi:signal transduction histidine kinase/HAMP domain-containing protein